MTGWFFVEKKQHTNTGKYLQKPKSCLKENNFWNSYILNSEIYNESIEDLNLYNAWVTSLKGEDFKRMAAQYFNDKEFKRFVLNPEK